MKPKHILIIMDDTKKIGYSTFIFNDYSHFSFGESEHNETPQGDLEYIPIFGVGTLDETRAWATHARRIKFTSQAITYYNIPDNVVDSNTEIPGKEKYYYDGDKPYFDYLIGKTVGIVKRMTVDGKKIEKYHCPKYELLEFTYPHMYNLCTVKARSLSDNTITNDINISRISIPELMRYKPLVPTINPE